MSDLFQTAADLRGYLFRITDNGGATADRYTVLFSDGDALCLSDAPSHPQGVSLWAERVDPATLESWVRDGAEADLRWCDLPENVRRHVLGRVNGAWRGYLTDLESGAAPVPETREGAAENTGRHDSAGVGIYGRPGAYFVRMDDPDPGHDRGPFGTVREALLAALPDEYSLAGPEYHSGVDLWESEQ